MKNHWIAVLTLAFAAATSHVMAHGTPGDAEGKGANAAAEETPFGRPGDAAKVTRSVTVTMSDAMRFDPAVIRVKKGETLRIVAADRGKLVHELVLGTMEELKEHAELMRKFPDMEHDEPSMARVKPGETGEIVWQFTRPGEFHFACLVPGHFEAGMVGKVLVADR